MRLLLILPLSGLAIASAARDRFAAVQIVPDGLTPRYFVDKSHPLFKREGSCGDNAHSCKTMAISVFLTQLRIANLNTQALTLVTATNAATTTATAT